jgi:acyl-CoA thioester hydrolase
MSFSVFTIPHRVSYAECTIGDHVYHARFLDILERARGEFFRSLGCALPRLQNDDAVFLVTDCQMKFLSVARYDEVLEVDLWLTELGGARLTFAGRMRSAAGMVLHESRIRMACTTREGRPRRMPTELAAQLQPHLDTGGNLDWRT